MVDARAGVRRKTTTLPYHCVAWASPAFLSRTKRRACPGRPTGRSFTSGAGRGLSGVRGPRARGIRSLVDRLHWSPSICLSQTIRCDVDKGVIKLAVAGRPNVGKSTLINTWLGGRATGGIRPAGYDPRCHHCAVERNGQRLNWSRYCRLRRKGKVFGHREIFGGENVTGHRVWRTWCCCCSTPPRRDRPRCPYRGLHPGERPCRGSAVNKMGCRDDYQRQLCSAPLRRDCVSEVCLRCTSSRRRSVRAGPLWASIAQAHRAANAQNVHAGAHPPVAGGSSVPEPQAGRDVPPQNAICAPGGMNPPVIVIHGNSWIM